MKYPKMNKQARRIVGVPSLSGGTNLRDAFNMCQDNQLTDSVNMWFLDGVLRTRAGKKTLLDSGWQNAQATSTAISYKTREDKKQLHSEITKAENGITYKLVSYSTVFSSYSEKRLVDGEIATVNYGDYSRIIFRWVTDDGIEPYSVLGQFGLTYGDKLLNYFISVTPKGIYAFVKLEKKNLIYKYYEELGRFDLCDEEPYAPLVVTHGLMEGGLYDYSGVAFEGENLLGHSARFLYSTVNKGVTDDGSHLMIYMIPIAKGKTVEKVVAKLTGGKIMFSSNEISATVVHTVVIGKKSDDERFNLQGGEESTWSQELNDNNLRDGDDRLWMSAGQWVDADLLEIGFSRSSEDDWWVNDTNNNNSASWAKIPEGAEQIEDNLEITVYYKENNENINKIFSMTEACWFGGASQGINGGTRLFLGGSTEEAEKSLIVWSGINEPLYFPENCYSYVGNSMSAVKGFGKQEDMLVIFKENELYYTKYAQNDSITAENLINQSVVDYTASSVYFPLVQINPVIGCLSADSVQLCRNRLVWLGNDKKVYTLTGASQYSERNVFCVSEMIERNLKNERGLEEAYALDFDGHYMLVIGSRAYLMDYNSYGYQYVYSYQKAEDANVKIPWYIWDGISDEYSLLFNVNDRLCGISYEYAKDEELLSDFSLGKIHTSRIKLYAFTGDTDNGEPIHSMAQTKFFDFGNPNYRKNIEAVGVSFGNNGGEPITVKCITESGEDYATITLTGNETDSRNAGFITSRILYPAIRSAVRFGVRFECEGNMAIEGLNITYRTLGGAR